MNRIIIIPDANAPKPKNNDTYEFLGYLMVILAVGGIGVTIGDRLINKSWWWKRLAYENRLREAEGLPKKSIISEITGLFSDKSDGW